MERHLKILDTLVVIFFIQVNETHLSQGLKVARIPSDHLQVVWDRHQTRFDLVCSRVLNSTS